MRQLVSNRVVSLLGDSLHRGLSCSDHERTIKLVRKVSGCWRRPT